MSWTHEVLLPDDLDERMARKRRERKMRIGNVLHGLSIAFLGVVAVFVVGALAFWIINAF